MSNARDCSHLEAENRNRDKIFEILLLKAKPVNGNVTYSPWSIYGILSLLLEYSSSGAKLEVERLLGSKQAHRFVENPYVSISNLLSTVRSIHFSEEYILWTSEHVELKESLERDIAEKLKINVKLQNKHSERESLLIENVLSFKAKWDCKFSIVYDGEFFVTDHQTIEIPMMKVVHHFNYKTDECLNASIVEIPFASKKISMVVVVPVEGGSIDELESKLCINNLEKIVENLSRAFISVQLPKLTIKKVIDVGEILQQLGVTSIFSVREGGLTVMIKENKKSFLITKILQRIALDIDDDGYPLPPPSKGPTGRCFCRAIRATVNANRPFILYVKTNEPQPRIIFQCKISNPFLL